LESCSCYVHGVLARWKSRDRIEPGLRRLLDRLRIRRHVRCSHRSRRHGCSGGISNRPLDRTCSTHLGVQPWKREGKRKRKGYAKTDMVNTHTKGLLLAQWMPKVDVRDTKPFTASDRHT